MCGEGSQGVEGGVQGCEVGVPGCGGRDWIGSDTILVKQQKEPQLMHFGHHIKRVPNAAACISYFFPPTPPLSKIKTKKN